MLRGGVRAVESMGLGAIRRAWAGAGAEAHTLEDLAPHPYQRGMFPKLSKSEDNAPAGAGAFRGGAGFLRQAAASFSAASLFSPPSPSFLN